MTVSRPSLRRNFSWTFMGNVVYAACLWGIISVLSKLGDKETVGRYALASSIATPIVMFANMQLRSVLAADVTGRHQFGTYLSVRIVLLPLAFLLVLAVALLSYGGELALVIVLFGVARVVESLSDIFYGNAQKNERMDLVSRSMMIKGPGSLLMVVGIYGMTGSLPWAMIGIIVAWCIPLLAFDIPQARRLLAGRPDELRLRWEKGPLGQIIWLALPLGLVMMMIQLRNTVPRAVIENQMGEDAVGVFAALSYLIVAGSTVVLALGQSSLAPLARLYTEGRLGQFKRLVGKLVFLGAGVGVLGVVAASIAGRQIITLLYTKEYAIFGREFIIIMAAGGFTYVGSILGPAATAMGAFRGQLVIQTINVGLMLALAFYMIPKHGLAGAAGTLLGGAIWIVIGFGALIAWNLRGVDCTRTQQDGNDETAV